MFSARKKHYYELSTASQGRPEGGSGQKRQFAPGPQLKGAPKFAKGGPQKV